jgi:hypothetical protein
MENLTGSNSVTLGLLDVGSYGSGFSSLALTVTNGSTTLLSKTFSTLSAAQSYFTDDPISLGTLTGNLNLTVTTKLTATGSNGVATDFLIGSAAAGGAAAAQPALIRIPAIASPASGGSVTLLASAPARAAAAARTRRDMIRPEKHRGL